MAQVFVTHTSEQHAFPRCNLINRDPKSLSAFSYAFVGRLGSDNSMPTANHPETDVQAERTNPAPPQYLGLYT